MLFAISKRKGAKTFLINARISEKSYNNYLRFKWLYKRIFKNIGFLKIMSAWFVQQAHTRVKKNLF